MADGDGDAPASASRYAKTSTNYNDLPTYPERPSFKDFKNGLRPNSQVVVFDGSPGDPFKPSSMPIYQTSTFVQPSASEFGPYDYTRSGNPTRTALEKHVALLESAYASFAFGTGMSALMTVTRLVKPGEEVIIGEDIYGGMYRLLTNISRHQGIVLVAVDTTNLDLVEAAITPRTKLVHIETPSNPMMHVTDIRRLSAILQSKGVLLSVDATMMSPHLMKPISLGADICVQSATKFFGGHADTMGGFVSVGDANLANQIAFCQNAEGTALGPFDSWLFLRGIKTLAIRIDRAQATAQRIAELLGAHPQVTKVFYPGLKDHPGHELHFSQAKGAGCVLSFTTGNLRFSQRVVDALRLYKLTVSFGSVHSLCEMPCTMSHASVPDEERTLPSDLIRLSIGIEDADDLAEDLVHAFELAASDVPDIIKFKKAEQLLYDSQFQDMPVVPVAPSKL